MHNLQTEQIGRRVVVVSAITQFFIFGIRLSFSAFFAEFTRVDNWSSQAAASIFSVSMLMFAIGSVPGGILLDHVGPRIVFSCGAFLLSLGLLTSSFAQNASQLVITYGIIGGIGLSMIGLGPTAAHIAMWIPPSRRGRAIGITFASTGLGSLVFVPIINQIILLSHWRITYAFLGVLTLIIVLPLFLFGFAHLPSPNTTQNFEKSVSQRALFFTSKFWVLLILAFTTMGPIRSLTVHQIAYMESVGIDRNVAALIVGISGFLTVFTFAGWGLVSDRFSRFAAFGAGSLFLVGTVIILWLLSSSTHLILLFLYPILFALAEGSRSSQVTALASDAYQGNRLGTINGWVGSMFGFGSALGPWCVGFFHDMTNSYNWGLLTIIIITAISFIMFALIQRQTRMC